MWGALIQTVRPFRVPFRAVMEKGILLIVQEKLITRRGKTLITAAADMKNVLYWGFSAPLFLSLTFLSPYVILASQWVLCVVGHSTVLSLTQTPFWCSAYRKFMRPPSAPPPKKNAFHCVTPSKLENRPYPMKSCDDLQTSVEFSSGSAVSCRGLQPFMVPTVPPTKYFMWFTWLSLNDATRT